MQVECDYYTKAEENAFRKEVLDTFEMLEQHLGRNYTPGMNKLRKRLLY